MNKVGAQRAADLTGRSKSTIQRAMNAGKLSFEVDSTGRKMIDVSELDRAFGLKPIRNETNAPEEKALDANMETRIEIERLRVKVQALETQVDSLEDQLDDLRAQRDLWQKQAQQVLLTSQYSQKQAEELKETLKERDRQAQERRRQIMEARAKEAEKKSGRFFKSAPPENQNARPTDGAESKTDDSSVITATGPAPTENKNEIAETETGGLLDFQGLWQRIKTRAGTA